jgi:hypothetical protein
MGTFDIGHPDVMEFIRAKREAGRLRQFNLSLLITREFMEAVKNDRLARWLSRCWPRKLNRIRSISTMPRSDRLARVADHSRA